jgi:hypothetical protein
MLQTEVSPGHTFKSFQTRCLQVSYVSSEVKKKPLNESTRNPISQSIQANMVGVLNRHNLLHHPLINSTFRSFYHLLFHALYPLRFKRRHYIT